MKEKIVLKHKILIYITNNKGSFQTFNIIYEYNIAEMMGWIRGDLWGR
jgi:hypothetical protein